VKCLGKDTQKFSISGYRYLEIIKYVFDLLPHGKVKEALHRYAQSWALALYFQVRSPLSAHFISMDRYCSSAHFANFQVRSSLNRSKKTSGSLLKKSAKTLDHS